MVVLSTRGSVCTVRFQWKNTCRRGQLGIGELCHSEKPVPVESLQGVSITKITCGAWHCAGK